MTTTNQQDIKIIKNALVRAIPFTGVLAIRSVVITGQVAVVLPYVGYSVLKAVDKFTHGAIMCKSDKTDIQVALDRNVFERIDHATEASLDAGIAFGLMLGDAFSISEEAPKAQETTTKA